MFTPFAGALTTTDDQKIYRGGAQRHVGMELTRRLAAAGVLMRLARADVLRL
jgi:hypothetical protein